MVGTFLRTIAFRFFRLNFSRGGHAEKIANNFSWLMVDRLGRLGIALVVGVWVARYLGPSDFGRLNYALAVVGIAASIVPLGLDAIVVRELVRNHTGQARLLSTAAAMRLVAAMLCVLAIVTVTLLEPVSDRVVRTLILITAAGTLFQAFDTLDLFFQAQTAMRYVVMPRSIGFLLAAGLKVFLITRGFSVVWFAAVTLVETSLGSLTVFLVYRHHLSEPLRLRPDWRIARRLLGESWPLLLSGLSVMLYLKIGQVMLGSMLGQEALGVYSAAIRVSEIGYFIPVILASSILPALVQSRMLSPGRYRSRLLLYFRVNALLAYTMVVPVCVFSKIIVRVLFGRDYAAAAPVLATHVWVLPFVFLGVGRGQHLVNEGLLRFAMFATLAGVLTSVAANLVLIPRFGPLGAAIAAVISYAVSGYFSSFFFSRTRSIGVLQTKALLWPFPSFHATLSERG
jgi:PST family polysaccharide transporter